MLFKNLCFAVGILLLTVTSKGAGDDATQKLTRRCKENERRALMEFKAGVEDEYGMLSSWENNDNDEECCNWRGIRCSNRTGHVTVVNIPGISYPKPGSAWLSGKVSPSLSELKHLKFLNLGNNLLYGKLPHQLANLTDLRYLDLRYNNALTSENLDWISHLHLLTYLDLTEVDLGSCNDWLNQILKLSSLTHLRLTDCYLPDPSVPLINTSFSDLNSLVVLDLSENNFISPKSNHWLLNLTTTLAHLDLSYNHFPGSEIPEAFGRLISLESLLLTYCDFEGMLPDSFGNLSRLATLYLDYNNFNGSLYEFLHPLATIEKNSIQVLNLHMNNLDGSLPDYFTRFTSIREMSITKNKLSAPLPYNYWQHSSSLVRLDLSNNQISGALPNLTLFSSLKVLALKNNKLEGTVPESYLSNLSKLTYLDLSSNALSFNFSFDWLPPFQLDILLLRNCTLGPHFPNWITSQRNISVLDISRARIFDKIPLQFLDLSPRLIYLNMSNNQIEGILPNSSLPDIAWLDLNKNLIQGPIPPLPLSLEFLDLGHNMFTGSLSLICTSSYTYLSYIDLSDNKLSGELSADCLMNSSQIRILELADNDFSGNIPTSIGLLNQLAILKLRNNKSNGQLPLSLMNITDLQLLDLSENKLSCKVPFWIGTDLTSSVVLSLRNNEFSGGIPPQIYAYQSRTNL